MSNPLPLYFPSFLSVVIVVHNDASHLKTILLELTQALSEICRDYEVIVVDNGSEDESVRVLKDLTGGQGLPNLQILALTKSVDIDTASWIGLEHALGDFVAVIDPLVDDIEFLPVMLRKAGEGADVVFARNRNRPVQGLAYRVLYGLFNAVYRWFNGIDLTRDAPQFRVLSRSVMNFILRHPVPTTTYRHLPATGGFAKSYLDYEAPIRAGAHKSLWEGIDRGIRLLISSTQLPMRIVLALALFGAVANLLYSLYVIAVAIWKVDIAPGWVTLSLQQSGMFFLISLVLLVLGEYVLHMARLSGEGPTYHVALELTSAVITRHTRLNVEQGEAPPLSTAAQHSQGHP